MKRIFLTTLFACLCTALTYAQSSRFDKFADMDGVDYVYISKSMLSLIPGIETDELDIRQIASKLDNIRILSSSRSAVVRQMKKEVAFITSDSGYEELMRVKEDKDHTTIYLKQGKSGKKEIVLLSADEEEFTIILITGSLTLQDIRGMIRREQ